MQTSNSNNDSATHSMLNNSISNHKNSPLNQSNSIDSVNNQSAHSKSGNNKIISSNINIIDNSSPKVKTSFKEKMDSHNYAFTDTLKARSLNPINPHKKNLDLIKKLNLKANPNHFCMIDNSDDQFGSGNENTYIYSQQKNNYYEKYYDHLRKKYTEDKNNYYTYSRDYLTLSFPMLKETNKQYENYVENRNV